MRLGIFGGTFDPVHYGHLLLAECCREQCRLDAVWFLPAAVPPHKQDRELTPAGQRIEMLELAIAGNPAFSVCRYETDRGGVNYTVDTLTHFRDEDPGRELFFLVGADMLLDLPHWRNAPRVCELALPVVVRRPGCGPIDFDCLRGIASPERIELNPPPPGRDARDRHQQHGPPPPGRRWAKASATASPVRSKCTSRRTGSTGRTLRSDCVLLSLREGQASCGAC